MLTFRKGTGGAPTAAQAMAEHLREQTIPAEMVELADYYLRGVKRAEVDGTAAIPRQDMPPGVALSLGLDVTRTATHEEVVNLLQGRRADGERIAGKRQQRVAKGKDRITYVDFTFSAPKSASVAMALAPTDAERHMIVGAHRDAWMSAMAHLENIVAHARKGDGGRKGSVPGKLGWVSFDHYTARPTIEIPFTEGDGTRTTLLQTVRNPKVAGDPQLHTHVTTPNVVVCDDGTVGAMDMLALHNRVHEVGAYYQAHLATNLRALGIEVVLDEKTESAKLTAVPDAVSEAFSKRTRDGELAAREYVKAQGLDWDALHPMELAGVLKGGARATRRQKETGNRGDDMSDASAWKAQAEALGYQHASVVREDIKARLPPTEQDRLRRAYTAALPVLERQFGRRAAMYASVARTAAARGLIAAGVESAADIDRLTAAMREHGVRHGGRKVPLIWAEVAGAESERRGTRVKITTTLHVEQEREAMSLAVVASRDRSMALPPATIARFVRLVSERDGLDFTSDHGLEQRRIIDALGTAGRFAAAVGVGGAGKTTLLRPLVEAWREQGREVYGAALAWRQSDPLADAGIKPENAIAIAALLARGAAGILNLGPDTVVVVDELSQVGTAQALALLRLQARHGFSVVAIGDDKQAQAIDAGSTLPLLRKALGADAVPELESTVRQLRDRDKETSLLFRQGRAAEAIERVREDGHAVLVQGGHRHAVEAVADLWETRRRANAGRDGYSLTVSAPTNSDARAISAAIRERRRRDGELGADRVTVEAADQTGTEFALPLAVGDRVRLFARTYAEREGRGPLIGHNGSVLEVERIEDAGLHLRNTKGTSGFVRWDALRDDETGRIRLTYGDVLSIDAIQGATSTEHINALPSGSEAVPSFKAYVAQSRSRETTWLVVSDGQERSEVMNRRALGNVDPIGEADVWANVARNLSRQPEKELATDLLDQAHAAHVGTVRSLATAFQPRQQRAAEGRDETTVRARRQAERDAAEAAPVVAEAMAQSSEAARAVTKLLTGPAAERKAARAARRSVRSAAARPKQRRQPMSQTEVQAEFAAALERAGFRLKGPPVMDGQKHRAPVEGDRMWQRSGTYIGHLDEQPAGYIHNFKTGEEVRWKADRPFEGMTAAERAAARERVDRERTAREAARQQQEAAAARRAAAMWGRARPVRSHPYLERKGVEAHGMRQDKRGNLLVPIRDIDGRIRSVQTITPDGDKLFLPGGRAQGGHVLLGRPGVGEPLVIAEGFATAATIREVTGLPVAVAFNAGNLADVARAYRERDPERPIVFAADNDHHLPRRETPLQNVGQAKAAEAAEAVRGVVVSPRFEPGDKGTDWNDYAAQHGREVARGVLRGEMRRLGVELPAAPRSEQTERDAARLRTSAPVTDAATEAARRTMQPDQSARPRL